MSIQSFDAPVVFTRLKCSYRKSNPKAAGTHNSFSDSLDLNVMYTIPLFFDSATDVKFRSVSTLSVSRR